MENKERYVWSSIGARRDLKAGVSSCEPTTGFLTLASTLWNLVSEEKNKREIEVEHQDRILSCIRSISPSSF